MWHTSRPIGEAGWHATNTTGEVLVRHELSSKYVNRNGASLWYPKPTSTAARLRELLSNCAMVNNNPDESLFAVSQDEATPARVFHWRIPFLLLASVIASVPFYGYFVHAARDSQETALWIMLCWVVNVTFVIGSIVVAVVRPAVSPIVRFAEIALIIYMIIAVFVGGGGVGNAIGELLAG